MDTLNAIENFPMPPEPTITDIRAWFGLVNQIAPFFATTSTMQPFRDLLKSTESKNKKVFWNEDLRSAFDKSKKHIKTQAEQGLAYFDIRKNT